MCGAKRKLSKFRIVFMAGSILTRQPCANCVTRSVTCKEQVFVPVAGGIKRTHDKSELPDEIPRIVARLDRVKAYIEAQKSHSQGSSSGRPAVNVTPQSHSQTPDRSEGVPALATRASQASTANNTAWPIEAVTSDRALGHSLSISVLTNSCLTPQQHGYIDPSQIQLPPKQKAVRLLQIYIGHIGYFQNIIYQPHALELIHEVYHAVSYVSTITAPRGLALILAVIAFGVILDPIEGDFDTVLPVFKQRLKISTVYMRASMDCLEQHRRTLSHSLENVQAMFVLQFLINHIETNSPRARSLLAEAVTVSHSLCLHLVDSISPRTSPAELLSVACEDPIVLEMKRRVWWYLTATDWIVSLVEGPVNAVYFVKPNCSRTTDPRNINDDELGDPHAHERPLSELTSMSYSLHRLKIAEIARYISDQMPRDISDATCELILSLDSKLESLILSLPAFFRLEIADSEETVRIDHMHPHVPMQRLLINFMANLIRCKLHLPFLSGHPSQVLHAFLRDASLKAARRVLSAYRDMSFTNISHSFDLMKIQGIVFHMFTGALILATDLCCNQAQGDDRKHQSAELMGVLRQLEGIKQYSQSATKFYETLTQLLVKYRVWVPDVITSTATGVRPESTADPFDQDFMQGQDFEALAPFGYEELWNTFVD
ncbi:hypothetical protein GE09DRAFT_1172606 [Coniochaeta sp. 2T2.1]|nr:hypothetical protein GE09DRAFT_1172606 [Coniochaeta sp. 2T2.1]